MNDELLNILFKIDEDILRQGQRMIEDSTKKLSNNELKYLLSYGRITNGLYAHLMAHRIVAPELYLRSNE